MYMEKPLYFKIIAGTHKGCVRSLNEDNFIVNPDLSNDKWFIPEEVSKSIRLGDYGCLMAVADGMGGANCGEVASDIAINSLRQSFSIADLSVVIDSDKAIEEFLLQSVEQADADIKNYAKQNKSTQGMGTTIIVSWLLQGNIHLCWCGDSRAYVFNPTTGLSRLSKDHSHVQMLVDQGIITEEQAFGHPESNIITKCLGDFQSEPQPEYRLYTLLEGDTILLCSDGLCGYCNDNTIEDVMQANFGNLIETRNALLQHALNAGGFDNITVALLITKNY